MTNKINDLRTADLTRINREMQIEYRQLMDKYNALVEHVREMQDWRMGRAKCMPPIIPLPPLEIWRHR